MPKHSGQLREKSVTDLDLQLPTSAQRCSAKSAAWDANGTTARTAEIPSSRRRSLLCHDLMRDIVRPVFRVVSFWLVLSIVVSSALVVAIQVVGLLNLGR